MFKAQGFIFLLLVGLFSSAVVAQTPERPNVLFIAVDDLRPEMKCYGVEKMTTPNLDRLARQGVRFDHAYPTVCELVGLPLSDHLQGKSMTPLLSSVDAPHKKAIFTRYGGGDAVRTERYHYLEMRTKNGAGKLQGVALFDLEKDPAPKRGMVLLGLKPFFFYSIPPDWVDELFFTHLCTELWHFRGIRQDRSILR